MTVEHRVDTATDAPGWRSGQVPTTPPRAAASFPTPLHQPKPWGDEIIFATGATGYVGKLILVHAGHSLSLQYHELKDEPFASSPERPFSNTARAQTISLAG